MRHAATRALLAAGLFVTPMLALADEAPATPNVEEIVVAEVNGIAITYAEVLDAIAGLPAQTRQMPSQVLVPAVTDQLIAARLIEAEAYAAGLGEDPEVLARLDEVRGHIVQDVWLERQLEARVTDEAIERLYEDFLAENPPQTEVRARHILVESEDEARDLIAALEDGADFAELAEERSNDPGSGARGGDLGYFGRGMMVPEFEEAVFALEVGSYSAEPVESAFGWHVILVEDAREVEAPSFDEMRNDLANQYVQREIRTLIEELRAEAEITLYGMDGEPLAE